MAKPKAFKDLQEKWYKKLQNGGFEDIEDTSHPNFPLKEWHSLKAKSKTYRRIQDTSSGYQEQIDNFLNHMTFTEACRFVIRHGNCKYTITQARNIWIFHTQGLTIRKISKEMNRSRDSVFSLIKRLREWMKYL